MRKKKLKGLVKEWMRRSDDDETLARTFQNVEAELKMAVRVRRNCAWELLGLLRDAEKKPPPKILEIGLKGG